MHHATAGLLTAIAIALATALATSGQVIAQHQHAATHARSPAEPVNAVDAAMRRSFPEVHMPAPKEAWRSRLAQDELMRLCSRTRGKPSRRIAAAIERQARAGIVYPADGVLTGDWRRGEAIAQSGYGQRTTDVEAGRPNGGNCYACHQLSPSEPSHGTLGPSLLGYGRLHDYQEAAARKVWDQIWNPHAHRACSGMPRFGAGGTLTVDQIRDLVALVMARDSPVNAAARPPAAAKDAPPTK